jgi:hypothetical protein
MLTRSNFARKCHSGKRKRWERESANQKLASNNEKETAQKHYHTPYTNRDRPTSKERLISNTPHESNLASPYATMATPTDTPIMFAMVLDWTVSFFRETPMEYTTTGIRAFSIWMKETDK